jgi:uncharacterized RDD family membrane protein YckC
MDWFYAKNNQQLGPVSFEILTGMLQRGELQAGDLVWHDGMPSWIPASTAPELAHIFQAAASSIGYYNPVAAARTAMGGQFEYAGFWLRFVAYIIDSILLGVVNFILNMIFQVQGSIFAPHSGGQAAIFAFFVAMAEWAIAWLYFAFMESSQMQATLGKLALGLVVTDMAGQPISFGRATGRYFGKIISGLTLLIGYMMAGWTQQKQALHDIMASCLVIRKR